MVRENSPAKLAGLMKNDRILTVNGRVVASYTLEELTHLMKYEVGKIIEMKIERNEIKSNFRFILEDPLSFEHQNR